jgi:glyoxylase-like metal-dependent hydrolase (beta-lactamase superfamily II)
MYEVIVLFSGYSVLQDGRRTMKANCTCTLVKSEGSGPVVIVDTMTAWDGERIAKTLMDDHGLECDDVDFVVCTHGHSDHVGNNNLFKKAGAKSPVKYIFILRAALLLIGLIGDLSLLSYT